MKTSELVILALLIFVAALVAELWAKRRADEQVKALAADWKGPDNRPLVTGFAGGVAIT